MHFLCKILRILRRNCYFGLMILDWFCYSLNAFQIYLFILATLFEKHLIDKWISNSYLIQNSKRSIFDPFWNWFCRQPSFITLSVHTLFSDHRGMIWPVLSKLFHPHRIRIHTIIVTIVSFTWDFSNRFSFSTW